jgi:ABC-type uncharacterized transport system permease subunit
MINFVLSTFTRYLIFTTLYAMEKESEKNNKQIVVFKNVTHNISDYFRLTSVSIFYIDIPIIVTLIVCLISRTKY